MNEKSIKLINVPDSPKLSINPSTHPVRQRALLTIFARKNNVPIDPPSSGPNVLLIMTVDNHKEIIHNYGSTVTVEKLKQVK